MKFQVNITAGVLNWEWRGEATDKNDATQKAKLWAISYDCIPSSFKLEEPKQIVEWKLVSYEKKPYETVWTNHA